MGGFKPTAYNQEIVQWKSDTTNLLRAQIASMTSKGKGELLASLRGYINFSAEGDAYAAVWKFERQGIFIYKGVGRGYQVANGKIIRVVHNKDNTITIGRRLERQPNDWINPVFKQRIPVLVEILANYYADKAVHEFFVKGIGTDKNIKIE